MAENFLNKAKDTAKTISDKLKGIDNEKAQQASDQIDKFTGGSNEENKDGENKDGENRNEENRNEENRDGENRDGENRDEEK